VLDGQFQLTSLGKQWFPVVDGYLIANDPLEMALKGQYWKPLDIAIGDVTDEGTMFVNLTMSREAFFGMLTHNFGPGMSAIVFAHYQNTPQCVESYGYCAAKVQNDFFFTCPSRRLITAMDNNKDLGGDIFQWQFDHVPSWISCPGPYCYEEPWKVAHSFEIYYVFGNPVNSGYPFTPAEEALSLSMRQYWARFAHGQLDKYNQQWTVQDRSFYRFNATSSGVGKDYDAENCDFWDKYTKAGLF
jgi:carboxylesterase type B